MASFGMCWSGKTREPPGEEMMRCVQGRVNGIFGYDATVEFPPRDFTLDQATHIFMRINTNLMLHNDVISRRTFLQLQPPKEGW